MGFHNDYADDLPGCCLLYANYYVQFFWGGNCNGKMISVHHTVCFITTSAFFVNIGKSCRVLNLYFTPFVFKKYATFE